jgi:glycosyltransferase involved in cell wall biosynthesis
MAGRVLFVTSNYPRWTGDSTTPFVHDLAVDLGGRGWPVTVLAPHFPGAARLEHLDGVEVHRFRYLRPESAQTVCYGGGALVNLAGSRATLAKVPALVVTEWAATAALLRRRFDVLHAHWVLPQGFVATSVPARGAATVITAHGGDVFGLRGGIVDRFSRWALDRADAVTVNSAATARAVGEIAPGADVTTIAMGVDVEARPDPDEVAAIRSRGGPLLVFVGRVVPDKGVDDLLAALTRLPGVRAAVVGTGQHLDSLRASSVELGVADRVEFTGWVDPARIPAWLAAADVVVAPSRIGRDGWQEGQGLSIIEAMAQRRPVVATATGGIPETIEDGVTGVLVAPQDPAALAAALSGLLADPAAAAVMGARAQASVRERFSRAAAADRFAALYERLTR